MCAWKETLLRFTLRHRQWGVVYGADVWQNDCAPIGSGPSMCPVQRSSNDFVYRRRSVSVGNVFFAIAFRVLAVSPHSANLVFQLCWEPACWQSRQRGIRSVLIFLIFLASLIIVFIAATGTDAFCHNCLCELIS
jgi:hypothetical protein